MSSAEPADITVLMPWIRIKIQKTNVKLRVLYGAQVLQ